MSAQVESKKKALEGVRVLDLSNVLAGPFCATVLGEFGADVVKVELPGKGDTMRHFGTMTATGATLNWLSEARNKRCITLDLRKPAGLDIAKRLVAQSDIVVENFTTGTLEGWGLGYEDMKKVNPEVILVRITAYGQTGPYNDRPGFARIAHGFAGLAHLADIGLYEGVFRMLDEMAAAYAKSGYVRQRMGADTVNVVPHSHYRTRDDKWIALACTNDRMWQRLCKAMDRLDLLAADRYATMAQRLAERDRVNGIVAAFVGSMDRDSLLKHCQHHEVPAGPINTIADIFEDPQFAARQNLVEIFDPREGRVVVPNVLPKLSETPGELKWLGPDMGQHNDEIYRGRLGLSAEEIERLKGDGII